MKLTHLSTLVDCFGINEVTIKVDDKKIYTFALKTEYDVEVFFDLLVHTPGKALNWLKKVCIKDAK